MENRNFSLHICLFFKIIFCSNKLVIYIFNNVRQTLCIKMLAADLRRSMKHFNTRLHQELLQFNRRTLEDAGEGHGSSQTSLH